MQAIATWWLNPEGQTASVGEAVAVVAAIEPMIRADQIAKDRDDYDGDPSAGWHLEYQQDAIRALEARWADLRAQVEALRMEAWDEFRSIDSPGEHERKRALSGRARVLKEVLDLMDGSNDA
jgi:hypothetical protein